MNDGRTSGNTDNLSFYALLGVLQNGMILQSDVDIFLKPYGLSHGQFSILLAILESETGTLITSVLAEKLGRSKPTITKMADKLLEEGYLNFTADESDKRKKHYSLTDKSEKLLSRINPVYSERIREFCINLSEIEKYRLIEILNKLNVKADKKFLIGRTVLPLGEKSRLIRLLCESGEKSDMDGVLSFLDGDADLPTTKIVDHYLGTVTNPEGVKRIEHYLFNGTQMQRNYCTLFFSRRNEWDPVNRAYRAGLIDFIQAYSR